MRVKSFGFIFVAGGRLGVGMRRRGVLAAAAGSVMAAARRGAEVAVFGERLPFSAAEVAARVGCGDGPRGAADVACGAAEVFCSMNHAPCSTVHASWFSGYWFKGSGDQGITVREACVRPPQYSTAAEGGGRGVVGRVLTSFRAALIE